MPIGRRPLSYKALTTVLSLTLALALGSAGCSDDDDETTAGTRFDPASVSINVGDAVKWNGVSGQHTVTSGTGSSDPNVGDVFDEQLAAGGSYTHVFALPGTYPYFCRPHEADGMEGTVTVSTLTPKRVNVSATAGNAFSPDSVMINVGDTVRWTSSGSHSVTSGTGTLDPQVGDIFDRTSFDSGETFSFAFTTAGTFNYFCRPHEGQGMNGKVVVALLAPKQVEVDALD